jgi:hypothetical protein
MSAATNTIEGTSAHSQFTTPTATHFGDESAIHHSHHRQQVDEARSGEESTVASDSAKAETDSVVSESGRVERIVDYCADPEQAITNYRLIGVAGLMTVVILIQSAFCFALYLRRPDRIVVDRTQGGDRVVVMNDREYGLSDGVEFSKDAPTAGDKKYLVARYLELLYGNNPDARDKQLEQAIRLMNPVNGRKFFNYLRDNRILEQQAQESWQAVWTPQSISVDANDPFTVRAIGLQKLTRVVNGASVEETRQLNVVVKLSRDQLGRDDRNLRTSYLVDWFDWGELRDPHSAQSTNTSIDAAQDTRASQGSVRSGT